MSTASTLENERIQVAACHSGGRVKKDGCGKLELETARTRAGNRTAKDTVWRRQAKDLSCRSVRGAARDADVPGRQSGSKENPWSSGGKVQYLDPHACTQAT